MVQMLKKEIQTYPYGSSLRAYKKTRTALKFSWHYHWDWEITLTRNVQGQRFIADHVDDISGCDLVLTRPGVTHTWHAKPKVGDDIESYIIMVPANWFLSLADSGLNEAVELNNVLERCDGAISYSQNTINNVKCLIIDLVEESQPLLRFGLFIRLMHLLMSCEDSSRVMVGNRRHSIDADSRLSNAITFMANSYQEALTIDQVASAANLSVSSLKRHFKNSMQLTFSDYLQHLRIGHACYLLTNTAKPVEVIAHESGYGNVSLFHRHFKRYKKVTPLIYRKLRI